MKEFISSIEEASTIAITGHIHPDGDCIGSCLGLRQYILDNYKEKKVDVYLEPIPEEFHFLPGVLEVHHEPSNQAYDLFFILDCSSTDRFEPFAAMYEASKHSFCVDHHMTNKGIGDGHVIQPESSATCEVLYELFDDDKITLDCALCLYTGIVHDTGVFKHSNTKKKTMMYAGNLIDKGIKTSKVIDETFYQKTWTQNKILGQALLKSEMFLNQQVIMSSLMKEDFQAFNAKPSDTSGVIDQLRITKGVEVAVFIYALSDEEIKVSMRSNGKVNVAAIAEEFGGGGHILAAGFSMDGCYLDAVNALLPRLKEQL